LSNPTHKKIAKIAEDCHTSNGAKREAYEAELDELVATVLGIPSANLKIMRDELDLLRGIAPSIESGLEE
jgi:hypothetical protein